MRRSSLLPVICTLLSTTGSAVFATTGKNASEPAKQETTLLNDSLHLQANISVYDTIIAQWKEQNRKEAFESFTRTYINLDTTGHPYREAVTPYTDQEYRQRLRGVVSPIHLPYNDIVRKHIVAYVSSHRSLTSRMLGASQYYFPIIERELERAGLPLELKFLPVIESSLQPTAASPGGAVGLWQFMLPTGRQYGLEISSLIDQRRDPIASTRAACRYLKDLYGIFGDWTLAIASYNYGPGNVSKALQRAGANAKTYWDIYPYLPPATRDYIPAFVGLTYAYYYYQDHHIRPNAPALPLATDTVLITRNLHLEQVSSQLNLPLDLLRALNPQYKADIIPAAVRSYPLTLPQRDISRFLTLEERIYASESLYLDEHLTQEGSTAGEKVQTPVRTSTTKSSSSYKVRKGDTLGSIAAKLHVTAGQLKKWNGITNVNKLQIGQTLKINN